MYNDVHIYYFVKHFYLLKDFWQFCYLNMFLFFAEFFIVICSLNNFLLKDLKTLFSRTCDAGISLR
jgi:hypothetical protein